MAVQVEHSDGTLIIGFSGKFYCLWEVWPHWYTGNPMAHYIKKLSTDLEKAKAMVPRAIVDLDVHGEKWIVNENREPMTEEEQIWARRDETIFLFGKYNNMSIMDCPDHSYIRWYWTESQSRIAEMALMKAGYRWLNETWVSPEYFERHIDKLIAKKRIAEGINGHHLRDGERVELNLRQLDQFDFVSYYGTCNVITYVDDQNRIFKYMGAASPCITGSEVYADENTETIANPDGSISYITAPAEEYTTVKATISHDNYNDKDETKLKRIKVK